eukprot:SAG25_NODE_2774_length_1390_cov_1.681642_2_plen_201_part_00
MIQVNSVRLQLLSSTDCTDGAVRRAAIRYHLRWYSFAWSIAGGLHKHQDVDTSTVDTQDMLHRAALAAVDWLAWYLSPPGGLRSSSLTRGTLVDWLCSSCNTLCDSDAVDVNGDGADHYGWEHARLYARLSASRHCHSVETPVVRGDHLDVVVATESKGRPAGYTHAALFEMTNQWLTEDPSTSISFAPNFWVRVCCVRC